MERRGGIQLAAKLNKLKEDLDEYFGALNELEMQVRPIEKVPEPPEELVIYRLIKSTGLHLVAGGLIDQPHIWLLQWEIVDGRIKREEHLKEVNRRQEEQQEMKRLMASIKR